MEPERLSNREALLERISSGCHELDGPKAVGVSASLAQLDSPVRICLVGLGRAGAFHMQSLRFVGARVAQLVCVVDTNLELARRTATEFAASDCVARATLEEVMADVALAGRVDAIIIASTTDTHYGLCKLALSASKATFTEKPISHHAEEVDEVICLAKAARAPLPAAAAKRREEGPEATTQGGCEQVPFLVGYQRRCDRNFRAPRHRAAGGCQEPPNSRPGSLSVGALRDLIADGALSSEPGIFHDMLSHDFDMIHFLTSEIPDEVFTVGHCYDPAIAALDDVDTVVVTLRYASGLLATVDSSRVAAYGYDQRVEVFGERGMLTAQNESRHTVELATAAGMPPPPPPPPGMTEGVADPMSEHALLGAVARAAERSWREGRNVKLAEVA
ncbi:hypothetical protein EMIHUDRAFT_102838 [Emiliania huxleyi CCMP1516]|uniref:Gfo/Idh/MocA-like oxidoreductase N-terminal domain-containing protein n=2 Tax=Emiliania huxleyi TaxID=2903 RepID=A0A0D3J066_EMIH1|nr:hypothetical protein EMIHUDRAFT_102838 [Emiliania huxleyi CCMP1516]EOD16901.1 hypothetical protein EMIHUDRAFT_102838 [Emiliania huxleyi CCMP1516]|eukprot:XP_005769330.1 hypothetical protein EMIHUDRAFT_102838 [Emiliania huxleyi CCMP1516]